MAFTEQLHPRGTGAQGGQFVAAGSGGQTTKTRQIGYDGKKGAGTGYGARGGDPNVKSLQRELNRLGIVDASGSALKVDGKFGPRTTAAVRRLQSRLKLPVDGKVTPALLAKLKKMTPSKHDQHAMHVRHQEREKGKKAAASKKAKAAAPKKMSAHQAHVAHVAHEKHVGKKTAAPKATAKMGSKPKTGMGSRPKSTPQSRAGYPRSAS